MKTNKSHYLLIFILLMGLLLSACNAPPSADTATPTIEDRSLAPTDTAVAETPLATSTSPAPSQDDEVLSDSFTLPDGQQIDIYDFAGGESSGTFQVEIFFTIIEALDGFLHVSWDSDYGTFDAWVKEDDVALFLYGDYNECPFIFSPTQNIAKTFTAPDGNTPKGVFLFDALVDLSSEPVTLAQTEATLQDASDILYNLTGFVIQLVNFGTVEITQVQDADDSVRNKIPPCYLDQKENIPDSLLIFSYGAEDFARSRGGFTYTVEGPPSFQNHFVDAFGADHWVYVMFNHYSHKYAQCGYDEIGETIISSVSVGGECANQPETACVMNNGYSMCANSINDLYASTPNYFSASTVIHEIMHSFGLNGGQDHYGTLECKAEMGWGDDWVFDDDEFQSYTGMCPYVFDNFVAGYRP